MKTCLAGTFWAGHVALLMEEQLHAFKSKILEALGELEGDGWSDVKTRPSFENEQAEVRISVDAREGWGFALYLNLETFRVSVDFRRDQDDEPPCFQKWQMGPDTEANLIAWMKERMGEVHARIRKENKEREEADKARRSLDGRG